jgi:Ni/Co efflux regulator RcnB
MKTRTSTSIVCALAVVTLGFGSLASAQDIRSPYDDPAVLKQGMRAAARGQNEIVVTPRDPSAPLPMYDRDFGKTGHADARNNRYDERYMNARNYHRGDRLPNEFRGRQHVVDDYRSHRLSAPPRGHQWVQVGTDYALVAVATGIIAALVLNQ